MGRLAYHQVTSAEGDSKGLVVWYGGVSRGCESHFMQSTDAHMTH